MTLFRPRAVAAVLGATALTVAGCTTSAEPLEPTRSPSPAATSPSTPATDSPGTSVVRLAFAGDVHFAEGLAGLLTRPRGALGPLARSLTRADLAMVNLESAITDSDVADPKELEEPDDRFWFRTDARALDVLAAGGVDVVTMANNHGADYGAAGVADTLAAIRKSDLAVLGIARNERAAFTPYRTRIDGTPLAVFAADNSPREGSSEVWEAGPRNPGVAAARGAEPQALLRAVRAASDAGDVVVVYVHWGLEYQSCPSQQQRDLARGLAEAGADVIVGSHAHVLQGSGWLGSTYVGYGLGNTVWYHPRGGPTGVLSLRLEDGTVVADDWTLATIPGAGPAVPLTGRDRRTAEKGWRQLQVCAGLAAEPQAELPAQDPAYDASVQRIGPRLLDRMSASHRPGCPVRTEDLRYVRVSHRGFDGEVHTGELVVHARYAEDIVEVFRKLYDAGWPIEQLRLVDEYAGDDEASMAANNTSAYNCRPVTGGSGWSNHAYGGAIDLNPLQNPYVSGSTVLPPAGSSFLDVERSNRSVAPMGVIRDGDVVVEAFRAIGWEWGGDWTTLKDYQHFAAPRG